MTKCLSLQDTSLPWSNQYHGNLARGRTEAHRLTLGLLEPLLMPPNWPTVQETSSWELCTWLVQPQRTPLGQVSWERPFPC